MKPQKQLFRHRPADGVYGDCHRTAIAIVLDMDAKDVPHFMGTAEAWQRGGAGKAYAAAEAWLNTRGIVTINVWYDGSLPLERLLNTIVWANPATKPVFILGGRSRTGCDHSVVCCHGEIICDPGLDDPGIVGPAESGFWEVTFFGILQASNSDAKLKRDAASERDRMDRAALALASNLINLGVSAGDFYITIGAGELHAYAPPMILTYLKVRSALCEAVNGCPVEWHDRKAVGAKAVEAADA